MFKGLFNEKIELIIKGVKCKSYSKIRGQCTKLLAVCFATVALASCGNKTDNYIFQTDEEAANAYKSYLSEVRNMGTISTERLIESVNEWQILRDSVYACIAKGTTRRPHQNPENTVRMLHDSLRIEFTRLALSQPRSFADVLLIKEKTSQYRKDTELAQAVTDAEPFFRSLNSVAPCHGNAKQTVSIYQSFLANTLKSGISGKSEMLAFIKEEDWLFRSFLSHLPELADADFLPLRATRRNAACRYSSLRRMAGSLTGMPWYIQPGEPTGESYFNERCDSLSSGDRFLSLASLSGDNLGTKIRNKYENRQKVWRKRENTNSYKIIDFLRFTDLYFFFLCFSLGHLPMQYML